jgi:hypothetical protein
VSDYLRQIAATWQNRQNPHRWHAMHKALHKALTSGQGEAPSDFVSRYAK